MTEAYDYIIVGGGSAGCVAAHRLVKDHGARVLLIERGGSHRRMMIDMPAGSFQIMFGENDLLRRHVSPEQPSLDGRSVSIAQANVLGGGSSVNALAYTRGSRADFDGWANFLGDRSWCWDSLLPYFMRQEGNARFGAPYHGQSGPLRISDPFYRCRASELFVETLIAMGLPPRDDFNAGDLHGAGYFQINAVNAQRCSAANAFIDPLRGDRRLTILSHAQVTGLLRSGRRFTGVRYVRNGATNEAHCGQEVILAAGAYETPKLLMLSGVGPAEELRRHAIAVCVDLPGVGRNMQDHNMVPVVARTTGAFGYFGEEKGLRAVRNFLRYRLFRSGPIATNGAETVAFVNFEDPAAQPNVQLYALGVMLTPPGQAASHGVTLLASLVRPGSRGSMRLRSADPMDLAEISPNWFSDPEDLRVMVHAVRKMRDILNTAPLAEAIEGEAAPGSAVRSDDELARYCKATTMTNHHPVGSCRMGPDDDAMAVLDNRLRVRGTEGLRVFDASAFPIIPSANTNAAVMAVADRGVALMTGQDQPTETAHLPGR